MFTKELKFQASRPSFAAHSPPQRYRSQSRTSRSTPAGTTNNPPHHAVQDFPGVQAKCARSPPHPLQSRIQAARTRDTAQFNRPFVNIATISAKAGSGMFLTFMFFLCNTTSQSLLFRRSTEIIKIHETVHTSKAHATYNPPHHAVQDSSRISLHANSSARKVHRCPELSQFHHKKQEPDPTIREAGARRQNSTASFEPNARRFQ